MLKKSIAVWINGEYTGSENANFQILCNGLHYSGVVFEGERVYDGKIFKEKEHKDRLFGSAETLCMNIPYSADELNEATYVLLKKSNLKYAYVRTVVFAADADMEVGIKCKSVCVAICVFPWESYFDKKTSLFVSSRTRPAPSCIPPHIKASGMYMMSNVYKTEAIFNGYDDSLLCDFEGNVADTTCANIFFTKGDEIYTPGANNFLHGITRNTLLKAARARNISIHTETIKPEDISTFDSAFITGTAVEVTPVNRIGSQVFKQSQTFKRIEETYNEIVHA